MNYESVMKSGLWFYAAQIVIWGTYPSFLLRIVHLVAWMAGWFFFALVAQAVKERMR